MRILTDCPERLQSEFASPPVWEAIDDTRLASDARNGWRTFSSAKTLSRAEIPPVSGRGTLPLLIVVGEAPGSQFDALIKAHRDDLSWPNGLAALALTGKNFHGRYDRPWLALDGNIHLSVSYTLGRKASDLGAGLTMLPAVAAYRALKQELHDPAPLRIKWINDVICGDKKIAGVLTSTTIQGAVIDQVVFGIGVNLNQSPKIDPTPFVPATTCLAEWRKVLRSR